MKIINFGESHRRRILEGKISEGETDGTNRYNFIQLHFAFASFNFSFKKNS